MLALGLSCMCLWCFSTAGAVVSSTKLLSSLPLERWRPAPSSFLVFACCGVPHQAPVLSSLAVVSSTKLLSCLRLLWCPAPSSCLVFACCGVQHQTPVFSVLFVQNWTSHSSIACLQLWFLYAVCPVLDLWFIYAMWLSVASGFRHQTGTLQG